MLLFLGVAFLIFGALVHLGRNRLGQRSLGSPDPTTEDRARGARWNAVFGGGCVAAGVVLTVIGLIQRL